MRNKNDALLEIEEYSHRGTETRVDVLAQTIVEGMTM